MKSKWPIRSLLIVSLVCSNILVFGLSWYSLHRSKLQHEANARTLSQNIARAVNREVADGMEMVDLALSALGDELEHQLLAHGSIDLPAMGALVNRYEQRLPHIEAIAVTDAQGWILIDRTADPRTRVHVAHREHFSRHQERPNLGLIVTKPFLLRAPDRYAMVLSKRYDAVGGHFAGTVYAMTTPEYFARMLSRFSIGPQDAIVLRDADLGLIARYPSIADRVGGRIGDNKVSERLQKLAASGVESATYDATVNSDGIDRIITFQRMGSTPMTVLVGLATEDHLSNWKQERTMTLGVASGFLLLSMLLGWIMLRMLQQAMAREDMLAQHTDAYQSILATTLDGYLSLDGRGQVRDANPTYCRLSKYTRDELLGMRIHHLTTQEDAARTLKHIQEIIEEGNAQFESIHRRKDGSLWNVEVSTTYRDVPGGQFFVFLRDITERKQAETNLRIAATVFESHEGMIVTDANQVILRINRAFTDITGYTAGEVLGQTPSLWKTARQESSYYDAMWAGIRFTGMWQGELWNRRKNGEEYPAWFSISAVREAAGVTTHYVAIFSDITQRKASEESLMQLAFYDPLTKLPNRKLLADRLHQALASSARHQHQCALLQVDVDDFRTFNDALGHEKGDQLLQQVAKRLTACVREGDTVARLGGDEFLVLMEDLSAQPQDAANQAKMVGVKVLAALCQPYTIDEVEHRRSCSIGITLLDGAKIDGIEEPLKWAELAMYQAKEAGRNTLRFFDPQMQAIVNVRASIEHNLHRALQENEFRLYYQPQVDESGRILGFEALIRWLDPQRGMVPPGEFIPMAEESHLIVSIGRWVLEEACRQLASWADDPATAHLTIAVNVSARQFHQDEFVEQVLHTLHHSGARANHLKLELTESLLISTVETVIGKMNALKSIGLRFSLDDFGTGYSSLAYLKRLPLDQLKIDQSFVRNILVEPNDAAIARMVIALAQSMGLSVIAEGVETVAQRDFLYDMGCHNYQGYLYGRPMPIADLTRLLHPVMQATC